MQKKMGWITLGIVALCLATISPAFAQNAPALEDSPRVTLPEIIVTATKMPTLVDETLADVTVITEEDIRQSSASSFSELLARTPSVEIAKNGSSAATTSL
ncbi:MAG: TonB-dependent receptor plug domain-containing protein, partial [Burkholderiales bacterium]|nr:TonB-dependent receptor plug domain-containing protein [Burkholderiales bacterium]